jgi:VIT1/CCC1 family predicted Fe2+/Mn2+ transporter
LRQLQRESDMSLSGFGPVRSRRFKDEVANSSTRLRVLFVLGALPAALVALFAPKAIALPAASLISLLLAFSFAIYAWRSGVNYRARGLTFWDLAGMLAFIGFGAGALSEPLAALELFGMSATK